MRDEALSHARARNGVIERNNLIRGDARIDARERGANTRFDCCSLTSGLNNKGDFIHLVIVVASSCFIGRTIMPMTSPSRGSAIAFMSPTTPTTVSHGRAPSTRPHFTRFPIGFSLGQNRLTNAFVTMTDWRRVGGVGFAKVAPLQKRMADRFEIIRHRRAQITIENIPVAPAAARLEIERHQIPRRIHRRRPVTVAVFTPGTPRNSVKYISSACCFATGVGKISSDSAMLNAVRLSVSKPHGSLINWRKYCAAVRSR